MKEKTNLMGDLEYLQMEAYDAISNYYIKGKAGLESEYVLEELGMLDGVETNIYQGTVNYNGKTYDISEIIGNTNEQKAVEKNGLKQITSANATSEEDKNILEEKDENGNVKLRMLIVEEKKNNEKIKAVIPSGFYYVTGKITEGLVISDKFNDDDNNSKGGNQFVWIPCNGKEAVYQQHVYKNIGMDDTREPISDTGNGFWKTYCYAKYNDWIDDENRTEKEESVKKYGGFYIARYEAGAPENAGFYSDEKAKTYWQQYYNEDISEKYGDNDFKQDLNKKYVDTYKVKNITKQGESDLVPVSKKNRPVWNYIDQSNAQIVSENMYMQSKTVKSYLVDGVAWDATTQWISDNGKNIVNSTQWGNYRDSQYLFNGLYALHQRKIANDGENRVFPAYEFNYGPYTKKEDELLETATGVSDRNKAQNIFDFAGNVWEWTTEKGQYNYTGLKEAKHAVLRGGGNTGSGTGHSASSRHGGCSNNLALIDVGFRVVVYIK